MCHEVRKVHKVHLVQKMLAQTLILILRKILHFKKALFQKLIKDWTKHSFKNHEDLNNLINTGNLIQNFLPKQADIDKILKVIQRKVLKGTHLPVEIKEIQAGYLNSPCFKDIYLYLTENKLPTSKAAIRKEETLAEQVHSIRFTFI